MITRADAIEWLRSLPNNSVDLIVTDPAYSSLEKHRVVGTTTRLTNDWFPVVPNSYFDEWFAECYRVLAKNSHLYFMCDQETMFAAKPKGEAAGFTFWKGIVWDKVDMGMGYHWRAKHEMILFFEKGKRKLNDLGIPDVLSFKKVKGSEFYPTEKPVELLEVFVYNASSEGQLVIDPFCGSGSTGEAALNLGRRFMGADITERAVQVATARLAQLGSVTTPP